jgi:hypothetical protein
VLAWLGNDDFSGHLSLCIAQAESDVIKRPLILTFRLFWTWTVQDRSARWHPNREPVRQSGFIARLARRGPCAYLAIIRLWHPDAIFVSRSVQEALPANRATGPGFSPNVN